MTGRLALSLMDGVHTLRWRQSSFWMPSAQLNIQAFSSSAQPVRAGCGET